MSIESWKKEYYPTPADRRRTKLQAIDHSIRKWEGLQPEALKKHRIRWKDRDLVGYITNEKGWHDPQLFVIGANSCALCALYLRSDFLSECKRCPLAQARDGIACDEIVPGEQKSPFDMRTTDPAYMLTWLCFTRAMLLAGDLEEK